MKTLPVKPEHQAEIRYLLGDVFHLQRLSAPKREIAGAMRRLAKRHLELYPEFMGKRVSFEEDEKTKVLSQIVYDSPEEWMQAMKDHIQETKKPPYVAFAADEKAKTYDVMGPNL